MRFATSASLVFVLTLGTLVSGGATSWASAAPTHVRLASGSTYCNLLATYQKKQAAANKALTPGSSVKAMKAAYAQLQGEEVLVLGVAPSSLQKPYKTVFAAVNLIFGAMAKVNYNYAKLSKSTIAGFVKYERSMATASKTITAYDKTVCGLKN